MQRAATIEAPRKPAEVYDEDFAPALFNQWGPVVCEAAGVGPGDAVLDVGCGTGACAAAAAGIAGPEGRVVGLDPNPEMLEVARRKPLAVDWVEGAAESLPFEDGAFDAVVSQFAMMFFEDRAGALREMIRVLRPGQRLAVAVCDSLERSDGYAAFSALLRRLFGAEVADAFAAPFVLGDEAALRRICDAAGLPEARIARRAGTVRFASIADLVATERACVWTLGGVLDDDQFARLLDASEVELDGFRGADGRMEFSMPALIVTAAKPG